MLKKKTNQKQKQKKKEYGGEPGGKRITGEHEKSLKSGVGT